MDIYSLKELSDRIFNEYDCFVTYDFMDNDLKVHITTRNNKKYGFSFNMLLGDSVEFKQWIDSVPKQFIDLLIDEALGKTQYYSTNIREYGECQLRGN